MLENKKNLTLEKAFLVLLLDRGINSRIPKILKVPRFAAHIGKFWTKYL